MMATGCPCEKTCTAPTTHCAVTHGPLPAGGTNAQPATAQGAAIVAIGIPDTSTHGLGTVGMACPPCAHITVAPICKIGPGIADLPPFVAGNFHFSGAHGPTTVKALMLIATAGPIKVIIAP
jgi:hypothetical protein